MSAGIRVYLVNAWVLVDIRGNGDHALFEEILENRSGDIADFDEDFELELQDEFGGFSLEQALRDIFTGVYTQPKAGFVYGWAFDLLCSHIGKWRVRPANRIPQRGRGRLFGLRQ